MTQTETSQQTQTAEVPHPHRGGAVATVKRYSTMLVSTERGRWTVLMSTMLAILENTIYGTVQEGVAGVSAEVVHYWSDLVVIPLLAFAVLLCADLFKYVYYTERNGGEF